MSAPRLLIWTETYWVGGSDRFIADLLQGLDGEFDVRLAGNALPALDDWLAERVPWVLPRVTLPVSNIVASPLARLRPRLAPPPPPALAGEVEARPSPLAVASALARARAAAVNLVRLRRFLHSARPDVVLLNNGGYPGAESCRALAVAARAEGVPRVVHFVHNMAYPPLWPAALERRYDRLVNRATDVWVTAANRASDALAEARDIPRERIRTVHYGTPAASSPMSDARREALRADLGFGEGAFGVVVVAAFERRKGHDIVLHAARALPPHVRFALVGAGPEEAALHALAADLGVAERVHFCGWRDDVDALLQASDALALPSLGNECLPFAILEAMAHGLPVVGTDVAGIPEEVQDGVTGTVVAPGDASALAEALSALAADPARARREGAAGRARHAELFSSNRMIAEMVALLTGD